MRKQITAGVLSAFAISMSCLAQTKIENIAPRSSFMVVSFDNLAMSADRFKNGHVWQTLNSPEMKGAFEEQLNQLNMMIEMVEMELELEPDSIDFPNGPAGIAGFLSFNQEMGIALPGAIAVVNFTDNAALINAVLDKTLEDIGDDADEIQIGDHTGFVINLKPDEMADEEDDQFGGMDFGGQDMIFGIIEDSFSTLYLCQNEDTLVISTDMEALENAMEVVDGSAIECVADRKDYQDSLEQVGSGDVQFVFLTYEAVKLIEMHPMAMFMMPQIAPMVSALGIDGIQAFSASVDFAPEGHVVQQRMGVLVDGEKRGLVKLFDQPSELGDVPNFISGETAGIWSASCDFTGIINILNGIIKNAPADQQQQMIQLMIEYGPDIEAAFESLGPEMYVAQNGPQEMLLGIRCTNSDRLIGVFAKYAPMMGMESHEFLGNVVYSSMNMAIGIGGGYAFVGMPTEVEDALRATSHEKPATIADDDKFNNAIKVLNGNSIIAWGYSDTAKAIDSSFEQMNALNEMGGEFAMNNPMIGFAQMFDPELLKSILGPTVWECESVDNGFVITSWTLKPVE